MIRWWALCRREWLEHRISLGGIPVGFLLILLLLALSSLWSFGEHLDVLGADQDEDVPDLRTLFVVIASPFAWLYLFTGAVVLLNSIFDERRDRSVLFWKSAPVSDTATVLSKLFVVAVVAAGIAIGCILATQFVFLLVTQFWIAGAAATAVEPLTLLQLAPSALHWVTGFFTQAFWLLPVWGWLLLVSASAPSAPSIWALAIPVVLIYLMRVVLGWQAPGEFVLGHLQLAALPVQGYATETGEVLRTQGALWTSASMWLGIVIGVLFIAGAVHQRRRNNQL